MEVFTLYTLSGCLELDESMTLPYTQSTVLTLYSMCSTLYTVHYTMYTTDREQENVHIVHTIMYN